MTYFGTLIQIWHKKFIKLINHVTLDSWTHHVPKVVMDPPVSLSPVKKLSFDLICGLTITSILTCSRGVASMWILWRCYKERLHHITHRLQCLHLLPRFPEPWLTCWWPVLPEAGTWLAWWPAMGSKLRTRGRPSCWSPSAGSCVSARKEKLWSSQYC